MGQAFEFWISRPFLSAGRRPADARIDHIAVVRKLSDVQQRRLK